jgi:hypothetical protein
VPESARPEIVGGASAGAYVRRAGHGFLSTARSGDDEASLDRPDEAPLCGRLLRVPGADTGEEFQA